MNKGRKSQFQINRVFLQHEWHVSLNGGGGKGQKHFTKIKHCGGII